MSTNYHIPHSEITGLDLEAGVTASVFKKVIIPPERQL